MKDVLLLDTNVSSFPIYEYLVSLGYNVWVMGGNPDDCLAKYSTNYIGQDYSDVLKLKKYISKYKINYIVPGCNDVSYSAATQINNKNYLLGLDSYQVDKTLNNKEIFKNFALQHNIPVPKVFNVNNLNGYDFPVMVKPSDSFSGRGNTTANKQKDIPKAIAKAKKFSKINGYVIEEYILGQLYSHSAFISNKKIIQDFIVEEHCLTNRFVVDTSFVLNNFNDLKYKSIKENIEKICSLLNLVDGLVHTQFVDTKDGIKILEITRRCPGDLYSLLIEKSTGFKYAQNYTNPFIGLPIKPALINRSYILRHTISQSYEKPFIGVDFNKQLNMDFIPLSKTGDIIKESPFSRIGLVFTKCRSKLEMYEIFKDILDKKLYNIT